MGTMADESTPSADGHELWRISNEEALALVDTELGASADWARSAILEYRLATEFQSDWKSEIGHWLHAAKRNGFLEKMLRPLLGEREKTSTNVERSLNDARHLKLHQQLAAAMMLCARRHQASGARTEPSTTSTNRSQQSRMAGSVPWMQVSRKFGGTGTLSRTTMINCLRQRHDMEQRCAGNSIGCAWMALGAHQADYRLPSRARKASK